MSQGQPVAARRDVIGHPRAADIAPPRPLAVSNRPYASALATVLRLAVVPYGYTLTVWTSGMTLMRHRGSPTTADIFLFMAGAVTAFGLLAAVVRRASGAPFEAAPFEPAPRTVRRTGVANLIAVGAALGSVSLVALIPSVVAWPLGAFAATAVYLATATAALAISDRRG